LRVGFFQTPFWQNNANFGNSTNKFTGVNMRAAHAMHAPVTDTESVSAGDIDAGISDNNTGIPHKHGYYTHTHPTFKDIFSNFDIYGFAGGRSRLVGYNVMLQGQYNYSAYTMDARDMNRIVHEFELGLAVRVWHITFIYEPIAGRTSEIKDPCYSRTHIWGAAYL
jgi:hypothetical protein